MRLAVVNRAIHYLCHASAGLCVATSALAQQPSRAPDPSLKLDLLVIVAHADDETVITPYLARAAFDQHKRIGVLFTGSGAGGYNQTGRERGLALGLIRCKESERALDAFGIEHLWFIGDRTDGGSSNPLTSLANWGHGATLERVVRIVRATRPDVILSWLPAQVIGENHGDHQATGVVAAEAFDLAADPTAFPAQLASFGDQTEGLQTWIPRKLYFFSDAFDLSFLKGTGPAYASLELSPVKKRSYASLAAEPLTFYPTQFTGDLERLFGVDLDDIRRAIGTPSEQSIIAKLMQGSSPFWPEPIRLLRARCRVASRVAADVFDGVARPLRPDESPGLSRTRTLEIGGPWSFERELSERRHLDGIANLPAAIAIQPSAHRVSIPLKFTNRMAEPVTVRLILESAPPPGWREEHRDSAYLARARESIEAVSVITTPGEKTPAWQAIYRAEVRGNIVARTSIKLQVTEWTMAQ